MSATVAGCPELAMGDDAITELEALKLVLAASAGAHVGDPAHEALLGMASVRVAQLIANVAKAEADPVHACQVGFDALFRSGCFVCFWVSRAWVQDVLDTMGVEVQGDAFASLADWLVRSDEIGSYAAARAAIEEWASDHDLLP